MSDGIKEQEGNMSEGESSETSEDGYIEQSFEVKVYSVHNFWSLKKYTWDDGW